MGKTAKGQDKVKVKLEQAKKKIARKIKGACAAIAVALVFVSGCMDTSPASRATSASYEDIAPRVVVEVSYATGVVVNASAPITFGDGALASADSSGSTETQTATPTMDIKTNLDLRYNDQVKAASGALENLLGGGAGVIAQWLSEPGKNTVSVTDKDGNVNTAECVDGRCTTIPTRSE